MTIASNESALSGGEVRDLDGRQVVSLATGGGKTLQFAPINVGVSGVTQIVAAPASGQIKVVSYVIVGGGAVSVTFQSGATALTGAMSLTAGGGVSANGAGSPLLQAAAATVLNINLSAAVQVSGHLAYFVE